MTFLTPQLCRGQTTLNQCDNSLKGRRRCKVGLETINEHQARQSIGLSHVVEDNRRLTTSQQKD